MNMGAWDTDGVTLEIQIATVKREIGIRERVYPAWVKNGRMKQDASDREITNMKAVLHMLMKLQELPLTSAPPPQ